MKKIISLIACFSIAVFAQNEQYSVNMDQREKVQKLIKDGLKKNEEEIQKESLYLQPADREALYEKNRKKAAVCWAVLDFYPGFGLGSYIQGDIAFGITQSILDGIAYTSIFYFLLLFDERSFLGEKSEVLGMIIVATYYPSRIMSWIFPFVHQGKYNKTLKETLNGNNISYSIDPLIVPKNGIPAVGLAFNLRY